jgi:hypothetical protein
LAGGLAPSQLIELHRIVTVPEAAYPIGEGASAGSGARFPLRRASTCGAGADGSLSGMCNLARAKDAAWGLAERRLFLGEDRIAA